jgi:protein-tyrosine phosphatase
VLDCWGWLWWVGTHDQGRTGLMITCWMLYSGLCETAQEALEFYAFVRCMDQKGVHTAHDTHTHARTHTHTRG